MSKPILNAHLIGRLGNKMHQWAYARAYAEQNGFELRTNAWVGQKIFAEVNEGPMVEGAETLPENYRQTQEDLIYTRRDVRRWFEIKQEFHGWYLEHVGISSARHAVIHLRRGDYQVCDYVLVSLDSAIRAARAACGNGILIDVVSDDFPTPSPGLPPELSFMADFMKMLHAPVLFRANSTFSWWAAVLSNADVYAPIIEGKPKGEISDCEFVNGNWPRCANLKFVTDLCLKE